MVGVPGTGAPGVFGRPGELTPPELGFGTAGMAMGGGGMVPGTAGEHGTAALAGEPGTTTGLTGARPIVGVVPAAGVLGATPVVPVTPVDPLAA